jgi:hypothetical protein
VEASVSQHKCWVKASHNKNPKVYDLHSEESENSIREPRFKKLAAQPGVRTLIPSTATDIGYLRCVSYAS